MDTITSSFLPKFPHPSINVISSLENNKKIKHQIRITSHSLFNTFSLNKLIAYTQQKLTPKKPNVTSKDKMAQMIPKPLSLATFFKSLEDFVSNLIDSPLHPSLDPKNVLSGNFSPVDELAPTACAVVEGSIPSCLHGAYIRNGPNPQFVPHGRPYHLFDGDGMLHMILMSQNDVKFCSRYVKTYKYTVEHKIGHPIFPSVFSSFNGLASLIARGLLSAARILTRQYDPISKGFGLANTSVALIGGQLFALGESDLPYTIKITSDGDIITLGRHIFFSNEPFLSMTAHPKVDLETGEAFALRYHVIPPFLTLFKIDADGNKKHDLPILSMKSTSLIHDMAVTKNYIIFPDIQIVIDVMEITKGRSPARVDTAKVPRLGIIPKYATDESELVWIEAQGFNMMHCFNAWEEDDGETIVMVASNTSSVEQVLERLDLARPRLEKVTINLKAKTLKRCSLSDELLEMGGVNPNYAGKKSRYAYIGIVDQPMKLVGVVKIDLTREDSTNSTVASRLYGPGISGSEPFFVAREPDNPDADEDDGYLIAYVHDENTQESMFIVMDAKSPTLETVASVKLPGRVPTGFHGLL